MTVTVLESNAINLDTPHKLLYYMDTPKEFSLQKHSEINFLSAN